MATVCTNLEKPCLSVVEMHQLARESKCTRQAGGMLSVDGFGRLASNGGRAFKWRRNLSKDGDKWHKMRDEEGEEFGVHLVLFSLIHSRNAFDSMSSWYSAGYGWSLQREWTST